MIVELNIDNFAIIDNLKINFEKGFNVITGETGAGKSIIVEAISIILGQRASKELIRTGKNRAFLEATFSIENRDRINEILEEYGIDIDSSNYLIISRELHSNGRTISRVNGRSVTLTMLNNITSNLVDIHGQHEHQSLLDVENHIRIIDTFGNIELKELLDNVEKKYLKLKNEKNKLNKLSLNLVEREREIDLLQYQISEIDSANIIDIDEDIIEAEYIKLNNVKEIAYNLGQVCQIINNEDYNNISIISAISKCIANMNNIEEYDNKLKQYNNIMQSIDIEVQDLYRSIIHYMDNLEIDEEKLNFLEERINTINKIKKKYGNTLQEVIKYKESIENKLETLLNNEKAIEESNKNIEIIEKDLNFYCTKLTSIRKKLSIRIEEAITKELAELNMNNVEFKVNFDRYEKYTFQGWDKIEFLISTNKGESLKPLSKIASGGEMSRIMLAFKKILAKYDRIPCLIFDEIDTGISGRTAQIVGEKIKTISKNHQIICISHLPQIAALGDNHFAIKKKTYDNGTNITVKRLEYNERIEELSRLIAGVNLTDTTMLHAKEMLDMSKKLNFKIEKL